MNNKEYREALETLQLSTSKKIPGKANAAAVVGLGLRQVQRFAAGDSPVPEPVAKLLRVMIKHKIDPREVVKL